MSLPNYCSVTERPSGQLVYAWTDNNALPPTLSFSHQLPAAGSPYRVVELPNAALFLDVAASDVRALAVWQDHMTDSFMLVSDDTNAPSSVLGGVRTHGTMNAVCRFHPDTGQFHAWWIHQIEPRPGFKTAEEYGEFVEGHPPTMRPLPANVIGTSQGIRDCVWNPATQQFDVIFMDQSRSTNLHGVQLTLWQQRDGCCGQAENNADGTGVAVVDQDGVALTATTEGTQVQPKLAGIRPNRVVAVSALSGGRVLFVKESDWTPFRLYVPVVPTPSADNPPAAIPPAAIPSADIAVQSNEDFQRGSGMGVPITELESPPPPPPPPPPPSGSWTDVWHALQSLFGRK